MIRWDLGASSTIEKRGSMDPILVYGAVTAFEPARRLDTSRRRSRRSPSPSTPARRHRMATMLQRLTE
jgi:hypothetical protein